MTGIALFFVCLCILINLTQLRMTYNNYCDHCARSDAVVSFSARIEIFREVAL